MSAALPAKPLPTREVGVNGPPVSAIGFGAMSIGVPAYGPHIDDSQAVLQKALDLGVNFWDTADIYGNSEQLLSHLLKTHRKEIFLCTKFGITATGPSGKPEYVRSSIEASLKRLEVDQVDLYYLHRVDVNTPIEETVGEMANLVKEGKVRYLGLSECSAETLRRAYKVHPIAAVQVEYSPWTLDLEENGLLAACKELGVSIVAYSPLGRGFLAGKYNTPEDLDANDWRRTNPRFQGENFQKNLDLVRAIEGIAQKKGCTAGQLCLAWVSSQWDHIIPIPGTSSVKNLESNVASLSVKITEEDEREIRKIINSFSVSGDRYEAGSMKTLNQ